ncbi:MAG TPA: glycosyltransferase [Chroococcales cyanobacterium]|jgi:dolichol-phosphate mannosyltransferase
MHKAYAVIPTYNEAKNIGPLIAELLEAAPGLQVVVVDEKSSDGTGPLARMMQTQHPEFVQVVHSHLALGLKEAYLAGFRLALAQGATHLLTMDADFSHPPALVPALIEAGETTDLVIASRYRKASRIRNWRLAPRFRNARLNSFAKKRFAKLKRIEISDCLSNFRCYSKEVLEKISFEALSSDGPALQVELLRLVSDLGGSIKEVPFDFDASRQDPAKLAGRHAREARQAIARILS